jgi:sugar lactone lactonase YvrE
MSAPTCDVRTIREEVRIPNGLAWSPDGGTLYHSDTRGPWIERWDFDVATGAATNRQLFARPDEATGLPDSGSCGQEGFYWSAGPSAGRLNRSHPSGRLVSSISSPNGKPTMPRFGGSDLRTVFVTGLSQGVDQHFRSSYPLIGTIVAFRTEIPGTPEHSFGRQDGTSI